MAWGAEAEAVALAAAAAAGTPFWQVERVPRGPGGQQSNAHGRPLAQAKRWMKRWAKLGGTAAHNCTFPEL